MNKPNSLSRPRYARCGCVPVHGRSGCASKATGLRQSDPVLVPLWITLLLLAAHGGWLQADSGYDCFQSLSRRSQVIGLIVDALEQLAGIGCG